MGARLDASDLVQQTCLSVHKQILEFEGCEPAQFVAWLRQVHERNIRNAVRDQLHTGRRAASREQLFTGADHAPAADTSPSLRAIRGEEAVRLARVLEQLPPDEREALRLRYLEGRSLAETAETMQITRDALVWLMKRGMKKIRAGLGE
jgi:RNA polymerase sigma-70 factor (ECF subfamily)